MKHAISVVAVGATLAFGTAAVAAEHNILILGDAYFPQITYMNPGDTVRFINTSSTNQSIVSANSDWALGPIAPNAEATIVVGPDLQKVFYNADLTEQGGHQYSVTGKLSFSAPPLN